MRIVRKLAIGFVELLGALAAATVIVLAFGAWRLSSGPISLDSLTPYLEDALVEPDSGLSVQIEHTLLTLNREEVSLGLVARGVRISGSNGEARLSLPEIAVDLSLRAALNGVIAPTRLVLEEPNLRFVRASDGTLRFGVDLDAGEGGPDFGTQLLAELSAPPNPRSSFGYLRTLSLRGATIAFADEALGLTWRARRANVSVVREPSGISGTIALTVEAGGENAELAGRLNFSQPDKRLRLDLGIGDLEPARFASAAPMLAPLAAVRVPVSGEIGLTLDLGALRIESARADLKLGPGSLQHSALVGGSLALDGGQIGATYDVTTGRLKVERVTLDQGKMHAEITGAVEGLREVAATLTGRLALDAQVVILNVLANDLPRLWPERVAVDAREWVTNNIHDGIATETKVSVGLDLELKDGALVNTGAREFIGAMSYRGVTVDYFKPLPPVRGVEGTASFDQKRFTLRPTIGTLKSTKVSAGLIDLTQLDTHDEQGAITVSIDGPLRDALEVIDSKPLGYAWEFGIDPAKTVGKAVGQLSFKLPLARWLKTSDVEFKVNAKLTETGIEKMLFGLDLSEGTFDLRLDNRGLVAEGQSRLAGFAAAVSWTQSFNAKDPAGKRYTLKGVMDEEMRRKFGVDILPNLVWGPIGVDLNYVTAGPRRAQMSLGLDLKEANLQLPQLGWTKGAGAAGSAKMSLDVTDDHVSRVRDVSIKAGDLSAQLDVALDAQQAPQHVEVKQLAFGATDVSAVIDRRKEGGWRAEVRGKSLDISALMADIGKDSNTAATDPLLIDAQLDRLILGSEREARDVAAQLFSDGLHWQAARFDATLPGNGKINLRFGESSGDRSFRIGSTDLGATLRLFDVSENVVGGEFAIIGQAVDSGDRRRFTGSLDGTDYRVIKAPLFARLLSLASLGGVSNLLNGGGIPFAKLTGDFTLQDGLISFKDARAYGGAMGINASGAVDFAKGSLDLNGTLVPAYTLNSILGNIPLLGNLLLGGEGQGIFAANFRMAGDLSDPKINVNPLSALAPGVLRRLFLFGPGDPTAPRQRSEEPESKE